MNHMYTVPSTIKSPLPENSKEEVFQGDQNTLSRGDRVKNYYTTLKHKVSAIMQLRDILEYPESEGHRLASVFENKVHDIIISFESNLYHKIDEYNNLQEKISWIEMQIKLHGHDQDLHTLESLKNQQQALMNDSSLIFACELLQGVESIKIKGIEFEEDKRIYFDKKSQQWLGTDHAAKLSHKCKIVSQGITLHHIFATKQYQSYSNLKGTLGMYYTGNIYTEINGGDNEVIATIQHEHIHNCYDAFQEQPIENGPGMVNGILQENQNDIDRFINSCQGEIIANYDGLLQGNMATEESEYYEMLIQLCRYQDNFQGDGDVWSEIETIIQNFEFKIGKFYRGIQDLLTIANELSIQSEVKSLMILYKPTQYHKIFKYLEKFYGTEVIQKVRQQKNKVQLSILSK